VHAEVQGDERADKLANTGDIRNTALQWDGLDVVHQLESENRRQPEDSNNYHLLRLRNWGMQTTVIQEYDATREDKKLNKQPREH
jgi:hypothetical protein